MGWAAEFGKGSRCNVEGLEWEGGPCEDGLWDGGTGLVGGDLGGASSGCDVLLSLLSLSGRARSTSLGSGNGRCSGTEPSLVMGGFGVVENVEAVWDACAQEMAPDMWLKGCHVWWYTGGLRGPGCAGVRPWWAGVLGDTCVYGMAWSRASGHCGTPCG